MARNKIKTQNKPFNLDALENEARNTNKEQYFRFTLGGREWALPPLGTLDRKTITSVDGEDPESMMKAFKVGLGDADYAAFDELDLTIDGLTLLNDAWAEHSGITVGESKAS